jgi:hypothetical protein
MRLLHLRSRIAIVVSFPYSNLLALTYELLFIICKQWQIGLRLDLAAQKGVKSRMTMVKESDTRRHENSSEPPKIGELKRRKTEVRNLSMINVDEILWYRLTERKR